MLENSGFSSINFSIVRQLNMFTINYSLFLLYEDRGSHSLLPRIIRQGNADRADRRHDKPSASPSPQGWPRKYFFARWGTFFQNRRWCPVYMHWLLSIFLCMVIIRWTLRKFGMLWNRIYNLLRIRFWNISKSCKCYHLNMRVEEYHCGDALFLY